MDGHLGWFHVLAVVNLAAIMMGFHLDSLPGVGQLGHLVGSLA